MADGNSPNGLGADHKCYFPITMCGKYTPKFSGPPDLRYAVFEREDFDGAFLCVKWQKKHASRTNSRKLAVVFIDRSCLRLNSIGIAKQDSIADFRGNHRDGPGLRSDVSRESRDEESIKSC